MQAIAVITTVGSRAEARAIATTLVERRLAACAQIAEIESVYRWDGVLRHEPEFRVLLKTTEARYAELERALLELHPYDLPAIHALRFEHVHAPYAEWIASECDDA